MPKLDFENRFRRLALVYGEKQAREIIENEYEAYELTHLDYQALIVVASMQQEFERLGIVDFQRTHKPELADLKVYTRPLPGCWAPVVATHDDPAPVTTPTPIEAIDVIPFQYVKKVNSLVQEIHRIHLGISYQSGEVLYSAVDVLLRHKIIGDYRLSSRDGE